MLNRRHIRIKVMQALYAYWSTGGGLLLKETEKELEKNIIRLYELYLYLFLFLSELIQFVEKYDDEMRAALIPSSFDLSMNERFYKNDLAVSLINSQVLQKALDKYKIVWDPDDRDILRKTFLDLKTSETYSDYIRPTMTKDGDDADIYSFFLKNYAENFPLLEQHLEDKFISWHDDAKIAVQMVIRTLRLIKPAEQDQNFLMPLAEDEKESFGFAYKLLNLTIEKSDEFDEMIKKRIEKWEPSRIPLIDMIIIRMSMTEFCDFPSIPTKVTFNEYMEISKNYSAPNSRKFINGILDKLLSDLSEAGRVQKSGLGLL